MATLAQVQQDVADESTLIASVSTMIDGLEAQIAAIPGIPADVQTQIDSVFNAAELNKAALTAALVKGTPAAAVSTTESGS